MARNYPANTQIQKFLEESYNKERDTRLQWFYKSRDSNNIAEGSKQSEVARRKIQNAPKPAEDLLKSLPTDYTAPRYNKKKTGTIDLEIKPSDKSNILMPEMRPPTPSTKSRLYDGFTKEGKGRYQYLASRNKESPENKFSFPILSSWDYGWRLGDVIKKEDIRKPPHGRTRIVADTFYTRTGIPGVPT